MDKETLQQYYDETKKSLLDNVAALKSLLSQAAALSEAVQQLHNLDPGSIPQEVVGGIDTALNNLYDSISDLAKKIEKLFEDYKKLSDELFHD